MDGLWPWWLGGMALAVVASGFFVVCGRLLGVSGSLATVLKRPTGGDLASADPRSIEAAMLAATREAFGDAAVQDAAEASLDSSSPAPRRRRLPWSAHATLLVALVTGGMLGALSRGTFHLRADMGPDYARLIGVGWRAWATLLGGGVLVGFGTAMAGGCTSGHGLCGTARLQSGSLVATATFFAAAVGVSLLLAQAVS